MLVKSIKEMRGIVKQWGKEGLSVGYVPTMGALHEGHQSLIERAALENDRVVVSVFVNPTQFGPNEDFDAYPRDIEKDCALCEKLGVHAVFSPDAQELYFPNRSTTVHVSALTDVLCGSKRPGHFDGVCLVVAKFFNILQPERAYFGQKDAQQVAVVKRMVRDLNFDLEIVACPIVRELDGLAKSSRNVYLSPQEREAALVLNRSLEIAKSALDHGERNASVLKAALLSCIVQEPLAEIDYVEIVDSESLQVLKGKITRSILIPIAVYIGKIRLIDNITYEI
ncbi:pantothenate synthetase [Anaerotignum neopropionicum]|uniref:Pantothenate synthetase n=2 Tax=Anaerotignum neopropionicum TaxID=36847 RepID=A0A136WDW6_9FIRM|nr:pantoate--beta-alanine ligase [Anaerotignum neopropionicum]KXL52712.1 pantothenate synthetase [Anaerotignum neopropionicum]